MRPRLLAGVGLLVLLLFTSGCLGFFGPDEPDSDALSQNASYDWETEGDGTVRIHEDNYTAVYDVANKSVGDEPEDGGGTIELYERDLLGTEQPLSVRALQFRFENGSRVVYVDGQQTLVRPNGTTRNTSALAVDRTRRRTIVDLPSPEGQLAYTAPKTGKQITTPVFVDGSFEVVLPPDTSVGIPLLARVRPGGYTTETVDGRVHIRWDSIPGSTLVVRYYLERDILIFGGIVALFGVAGIIGAAYYLLQIRELVERREEVGLDVDVPDDDRDGPPPGMG
jgi:hypothetical protein